MQWTDEGIVLGIRRHGEANAILELMTLRARPPSRSGAGRGGLAAAPGAAAGQPHQLHLARAARRASRPLPGRGARLRARRRSCRSRMRSTASPISPRSAGCCPSAIRIRRSMPRSMSARSVCSMPHHAGAQRRAVRIAAAGRARLRARSRDLRGDRSRDRSRSTCRRNRAARCRGRRASRGRTSCCGCRRFWARADGRSVAAGRRRRLRADRLLSVRHVLEPRGLRFADARASFIAALRREARRSAAG